MTCSGSSFGVGLPVEHPFHPSGVELAAPLADEPLPIRLASALASDMKGSMPRVSSGSIFLRRRR
jgi:hypothetical protein